MLISATPDSDWTTIWASFVNQTPTNPNLCPTRADCLKFFTQGYPLTAEFKQPQPFIAAMDNWTTALIAKGITP